MNCERPLTTAKTLLACGAPLPSLIGAPTFAETAASCKEPQTGTFQSSRLRSRTWPSAPAGCNSVRRRTFAAAWTESSSSQGMNCRDEPWLVVGDVYEPQDGRPRLRLGQVGQAEADRDYRSETLGR
jgi:hypothetical protein